MSGSVEPLDSYTGRRDLIAKILEPYFRISEMLPSNQRPTSESVEKFWDNSLVCSWADQETGRKRNLSVSLYRTADGERRVHEIRETIRQECPPGVDLHTPNAEAYEVIGPRPGEHVFVLYYLGHLRAVVGNCVVQIMPMGTGVDLSDLVDPALDIGRTVGCSAYVNDFMSPEFPTQWHDQLGGWRVEGEDR